jgi:O-antigen/teichoic acid export membrane protein
MTLRDVGVEEPVDQEDAHWRKREVGLALRNAAKLGGSLTVTWGIGIVVRLYLPRYLGPERFGVLSFADAFTTAAFVFLGLGLDTYVRKEVSVRPGHASEFIGGIVLLRMLLAVLVFAGMEAVLAATHRPEDVRDLVRIYGIAQLFVIGSTTSAGLLHARGTVNEMSILTVVTKLIWGAGVAAAVGLHLGLWAFGVALALSEGIKSTVLAVLARKHLNLEFRVEPRVTWSVIVKAAPFYVSTISTTIYNKIDMTILAVKASDREVGWYGSATSLAGLTLLLTPLISWVMMPLFARAAAVSEEELCSIVRRALELILTLTIPVALMMALGSHVWVTLLFGDAFAPASKALAILAPVFVAMYVSVLYWCALAMLNRTWTLTAIFATGIVVSPVLNLLLIGPGLRWFGPGGGGAACAFATLGTELCVLTPMLFMMGRRMLDPRLLGMLGKTLAAVAATVLLDSVLKDHLGPVRLVLDAAFYVGFVLATRAVDVREMIEWTRMALKNREEKS